MAFITGKDIVAQGLMLGIESQEGQVQPCGIDLTIKKIYQLTDCGAFDSDNSFRKLASRKEFSLPTLLSAGSYVVEFNEKCEIPDNVIGFIYTRSSLLRSGVMVVGGVIDPGFEGKLEVCLNVGNSHGVKFYPNAKIAQVVLAKTEKKAANYNGIYMEKS
jgi:dUTP pyrophosphatase